jgi:hypothetical protein
MCDFFILYFYIFLLYLKLRIPKKLFFKIIFKWLKDPETKLKKKKLNKF